MTKDISPSAPDLDTKSLVKKFGSSDPAERTDAREQLSSLGDAAVDELVAALSDDRRQVRWEAANCLKSLRSPNAIPALINAMEDSQTDIGWLASEALIATGKSSLVPVLKSLTSTKHRDLGQLYSHAHHVVRTFACRKEYQTILQPLLDAFDKSEPQVGVPVKAYEALQKL